MKIIMFTIQEKRLKIEHNQQYLYTINVKIQIVALQILNKKENNEL